MFGLVGAIVAASHWTPAPEPVAPHAMWRDGVIVEIRGCDLPLDDDATNRCAALHCAQRVTRRLSDANQAELTIQSAVRHADATFEVRGTIAHVLKSLSQPTSFRCAARRPWSPELELFTPQSGKQAP